MLVIAVCTAVTMSLSRINDDNNPFAPTLYVLAVAIVARITDGFFFGIGASLASVACVNYFFTFPFHKFNMTISSYPLTFAVMLLVSILVSAMSSQLKKQERLRFEVENEKMRANLLRSVSHDLRTPLASIIGSSSLLLEKPGLSAQERSKMLLEIQKIARWLSRVTENILSVTKLNSDGVKIATTDEVVEEIVGSSIVKFRKHSSALPIEVKSPDEVLIVPMDATLIQQVLINLFENVEVHGHCATRILLEIRHETLRVVFSVADNGTGFPPSVLPKVFSTTMISSSKNADGHRNMGIGLSVCNSIIVAHGGQMSAHNNIYGGATVEFWLPIGEGEDEQQAEDTYSRG